MDRKCLKALKNINRLIDGDYQKLCDQMHNLELSHNRKRKALQRIRDFFSDCRSEVLRTGHAEASLGDIEMALNICEDALFCDGRERSKK